MIAVMAKTAAGAPLAGLTPTWTKYVNAATGGALSQPSFTALGNGHYKFSPTGANAAGIIDLGSAAAPRYLHYFLFSVHWTFVAYDDLGVPLAGLVPTWASLRKVSDGTNYTPQPSFTELGSGLYKTSLVGEHVSGAIDLGASAYPRYIHYDSERPYLIIPIEN